MERIEVSFEQLSFPAGVVLRGTREAVTVPFTLPVNRAINSASVSLRVWHSPAVVAPSALTVAVNGNALRRVALDASNQDAGVIEIDVPPEFITDYNRLELSVRQFSAAACQDPLDDSLWTAVTAGSRLRAEMGTLKQAPRLRDFPAPLADVLDYREQRVRFVLPPGASAASYHAAAMLAAALGEYLEYRHGRMEAASTLSLDAAESHVLIGTAAELHRFPETAAWLEPLPAQPGYGLLRLIENPKHRGGYRLVVAGSDETGLARAVAALLWSRQHPALDASTAVVDWRAPAPQRLRQGFLPPQDTFSVRAVTQGPLEVRGMGARPVALRLRPRGDERFVPYEQKLRLEYAYGPRIDPERSAVEVSVNGRAVAARKLSRPEGAPRETLDLTLPHGALGLDNLVEVRFRLFPKGWDPCKRMDGDNLWGAVLETTRFDMPRDRYAELPNLVLLAHSGYPLSDRAWIAVLPGDPRPAETALLLNAAFLLGKVAHRAPSGVYFSDQAPRGALAESHVVAVGPAEKNALVREAAQAGALPWAGVRPAPPGALSVAEVISPWNAARVLLLLQTGGEDQSGRVAGLLAEPGLRGRLGGQWFTFDGRTANAVAPPATYRFGSIQLNRRVKYWVIANMLWIAAASLGALLLLFMVARLLRHRYFPPVDPETIQQ